MNLATRGLLGGSWRMSLDRDVARNAVRSARRIVVAGNSGAGKTTLCRMLAASTGIEYTEMDSLFFGPGWTKNDSFETRALALAAGDQWITEWQYPVAREALAARAELFIWLDPPRWRCVTRVVGRSVKRRLFGPKWWNGNTEPPLHTLLTNRYHTARWSFRHHHDNRRLVLAQLRSLGTRVIRDSSPGELLALIQSLEPLNHWKASTGE